MKVPITMEAQSQIQEDSLENLLNKMPVYINYDSKKWYFTICREISGKDWQCAYEWINPAGLNEDIYAGIAETLKEAVKKTLVKLENDN